MVDSKDSLNYDINFYRYTLYDKNKQIYLLTLDCGEHIFLTNPEFSELKSGKISNKNLFSKLYEKGFIVDSKNFESVSKRFYDRYRFLHSGTSLHIVIPTERCNLGCSYCFAEPKKISEPSSIHDLDENTAKKIVEFILSSPGIAKTIEFTGGEALARFDLVKLMSEYARELNLKYKKDLRLCVVTNLTLANDEMIDYLIENDITICTSLDGPKDVHDKNRVIHSGNGKVVGTYDKVVYWINRINEKCVNLNKPWRCGSLMTITKYSLPKYKEIIDEYLKIGSHLMELRAMTSVGKATGNDSPFSCSFDEFTDFYKKSLDYMDELEKSGVKVCEMAKKRFEKKVNEMLPSNHTDFESPCGAATGQIVYHSNGDIYTCHEALGRDEFKLGNVFSDDWFSMFKKTETSKTILNSMLESNIICDRCVYKPYCGTCMIENFYNFDKFNFYPTKTIKHHETIMHCKRIFDELLKRENSKK